MSSGIRLGEVADLRHQLDQNLCGDGGREWLAAFKKFLRKENPWPVAASTAAEFIPWRTVTLGLHKTPAAYRAALQKASFLIGDYADDILDILSVAKLPCDVVLVMRSVAELGFTEAARYHAICARANELGLELCPAEVGPALRLAYPEQAEGDWFRIAMEPLAGRGHNLHLFNIMHNDGRRLLDMDFGDFSFKWSPMARFVFRVPASAASISP